MDNFIHTGTYMLHIQTYNQLTLFKTLNAITVSTSLSNNGTDYLSTYRVCVCSAQSNCTTTLPCHSQGGSKRRETYIEKTRIYTLSNNNIHWEKWVLRMQSVSKSERIHMVFFLSCSAQLESKAYAYTRQKWIVRWRKCLLRCTKCLKRICNRSRELRAETITQYAYNVYMDIVLYCINVYFNDYRHKFDRWNIRYAFVARWLYVMVGARCCHEVIWRFIGE